MIRQVTIAVSLALLSACKVQVIAPKEAAIITLDGSFICLAGQTCELAVDTFDIDLTLYAAPQPGYEFVRWSDGEGYICPAAEELGCEINTTILDPGNPIAQRLLQSDAVAYLRPVLRQTDEYGPYIWMHEDWPHSDAPERGF